jgi:hypothetical protein
MSDDSSSLIAALAKIDVLRHAAANAAPAISELVAVGLALELSESEALKAIEIPKSVATWCRKVQQAEARQGVMHADKPRCLSQLGGS